MISKRTGRHYTWGNSCDGWHLVVHEGLSVIQERMPPGTAEVRHFHSRSRQFFFVLSGRVTIESAGNREVLGAQQGLEIAPGVVHQVLNESATDVEFLVISQPPSHGDRIIQE